MPDAVLWDLDGTLIDPAGSIRASLDAVLKDAGLTRLHVPEGALIGMSLRQVLEHEGHPDIEAGVRGFRQHYLDDAWRHASIHQDVVALLPRITVPQAVVTTKGQEEADVLLERLGLTSHFEVIVGDDDLRPVKPHPAPLLEACRRLGIEPAPGVFMVGDTRHDVTAALAAGCTPVHVTWGHREHLPDVASVQDAGALAGRLGLTGP